MIAYTPTDICIEYIDKKDAYYLAKEGKIVYYASDSGRKSDFKWNTQTIVETCRIIRATMMGHEDVLAEKDLVRAFQEEGRVYEYGAKSRHVLASHVFNYNLKSDMSMTDEVVDAVVDVICNQAIPAILYNEVDDLVRVTMKSLKIECGSTERGELIAKHFEAAGFEIRLGTRRIQYKGNKVRAIMSPGAYPSEVVEIDYSRSLSISGEVVRRLK